MSPQLEDLMCLMISEGEWSGLIVAVFWCTKPTLLSLYFSSFLLANIIIMSLIYGLSMRVNLQIRVADETNGNALRQFKCHRLKMKPVKAEE